MTRTAASLTHELAEDELVTTTNRVGRRIPDIVVGDLTEREILAMAPSMSCDRIHWGALDEMSDRQLAHDLSNELPAYTRTWSDGQHRIWVPDGQGATARELIREWCDQHGVEPINMRIEQSVSFRNVDSIPADLFQGLLLETVNWLYPRSHAIRRRLVADLELVEDDDVRSMMYLFVSDHADRFDADRIGKNGTLNFATFMFGKLRTWPQDAARAAYGRNLMDDRLHLARAVDDHLATEYRRPNEAELAARMRTTVVDLRKREQAVTEAVHRRHYDSLITGAHSADGIDAADDLDVAEDGTRYARDAMLTRSIMSAVICPQRVRNADRPDVAALAAVYLSFWGELARQDVAAELGMSPKSVTASVQRVIAQAGADVDKADIA